MRLLLLANPEASAYKRGKLDAVERQLADAHDVTMAWTEERDHATALAREAAAIGIEAVVVLGATAQSTRRPTDWSARVPPWLSCPAG